MRHFRWAILIGELILLALALAVPRVDMPQTSFNEADTPINQATVVVVLGCRSALGELQAAAKATTSLIDSSVSHSAVALNLRSSNSPCPHSLLSLLCSLLC